MISRLEISNTMELLSSHAVRVSSVPTPEDLPAERVELEPDLAPGMEPPEGEPTRRTIKYTPDQQGAVIPLGWKPSARKPVPVMRCVYIFKDTHPKAGDRCLKWSLRGSQLCFTHSGRGNLKNVEEYRQAIIEAARLELIESAPSAVAVMLDLMANSPADNVRLKAAESVLDRTGIKTAEQLQVDLTVTETNPAVALAERLGKLKAAADVIRAKDEEAAATAAHESAVSTALALEAAPAATAASPQEPVEGEIIE